MSLDVGPQVAVEFDLYSDITKTTATLRLCNRGPLFSSAAPEAPYEPCLLPQPIQIGVAVAVQSYGQAMREAQSQGTIEFFVDADLAARALSGELHWVGQQYRVYQGGYSPAGFREDLALVNVGIVLDVAHDTKRVAVRTGDASGFLDVPLVGELYPVGSLDTIVGKPRPQAWGTVYNIEPVLIDDVDLIYEISRRPIIAVLDVRVGGIPWVSTGSATPGAGEYHADLALATIRFGSGLNGGDVRCDVHATNAAGVGELAEQILIEHPKVIADSTVLTVMDDLHGMTVGFYARDPINCLSTFDDVFGGVGAWWGIDPMTGKLTAGFVEEPGASPDVPTPLDTRNIMAAALNQTLPPAWRIRLGYERHWQTEAQYFTGVDPDAKQRWSSPELTVAREDSSILVAEPRAFDVSAIHSVAVYAADGNRIADRFWNAWSVRRQIVDVTAEIDPTEIGLYRTIRLEYMMFAKNFRIVSAIQSIGGGTTQLQLWG